MTLGQSGGRGGRRWDGGGRVAGLDWDQAVSYTLTQITRALGELQPETQP
jgi:hypothetical protein